MSTFKLPTMDGFYTLIRTSIDSIIPENTTLWKTVSNNASNDANINHCAKTPGELLDRYLTDSDTVLAASFRDENSLATTVQNAIIEHVYDIYQRLSTHQKLLEIQTPIMCTNEYGKFIPTTGFTLHEKVVGVEFLISTRANVVLVPNKTSALGFRLLTAYPSSAQNATRPVTNEANMVAIHQSTLCQTSPAARAFAFGRLTKNPDFNNASYLPSIDAVMIKSVFGFTDGGVDQDMAYVRPDGIFITIVRKGEPANTLLGASSPKRALDVLRNKKLLEEWIKLSPVADKLLHRSAKIAYLINGFVEEVKIEERLRFAFQENIFSIDHIEGVADLLE